MTNPISEECAAIGHDHPAVKRLLVEGLEVCRVGQELEGTVLG